MDPYSFYKKNQVENAPREDIMLQLVQGAEIRLKGAMDKRSEGESIRARELRTQARDIISYLNETLDFENGGDVAYELDALYHYMLQEIMESTRKDDFELLQPVVEILDTLYEGWKDAVEEYKKTKSDPAGEAVHNAYERIAVGS